MFIYIYGVVLLIYLVISFLLGDKFTWLAYLNYFHYILFAPIFIFFFVQFFKPKLKKFILIAALLVIWCLEYTPITPQYILSCVQDRQIHAFSQKQDFKNKYISLNLNNTGLKHYQDLFLNLFAKDYDLIALQNYKQGYIKHGYIKNYNDYKSYIFEDMVVYSKQPLKEVLVKNTPYGKYQVYKNIKLNKYIVNLQSERGDLINHLMSPYLLNHNLKKDKKLFSNLFVNLKKKNVDINNIILLATTNSSQTNDFYYLINKYKLQDTQRKNNIILPIIVTTYPKLIGSIPSFTFMRPDYIFTGKNLKKFSSRAKINSIHTEHSALELLF